MENEFRDILQEFLTMEGLTQSAFAKKIGVKQSQVSEWLKGKAKPGYDSLKAMAQEFNVSADYFLGLSDEYEKSTKH
ncbi:MAG TPA: XRE family transcriptional regulator [Clostridiales bacterium]|nr:XRE family transcriptional regulator [Clostridiales bacterium]